MCKKLWSLFFRPTNKVAAQPPVTLAKYTAKKPPHPLAGDHLEQLRSIANKSLQSPMRNLDLIADLRLGEYLEANDPLALTEKGKQEIDASGPLPAKGDIN